MGAGDDTLRGRSIDNYNPSNMTNENNPNMPHRGDQFGFVRYNENQLDMDDEEHYSPQIDREELANMITRVLLRIDEIDEVATLITDKYTFVAYSHSAEVDEEWAETTVGMTAASIVPGYYEVYISKEGTAFEDLASLNNNTTTETDDEAMIRQLLNDFERVPQSGDYDSQKEGHEMEKPAR
nr:YhcN/YlaJ family sporulation lipoprotein [Salirhabdus salicampi]